MCVYERIWEKIEREMLQEIALSAQYIYIYIFQFYAQKLNINFVDVSNLSFFPSFSILILMIHLKTFRNIYWPDLSGTGKIRMSSFHNT